MDIKQVDVERIISNQKRDIDCAAVLNNMGIKTDFSDMIHDREIISYILSEWLRINNGDAGDIKL